MKSTASLYAIAAATCLFVGGCGWVDSAGNQGVPVTDVYLDDILLGGARILDEDSRSRIVTSRDTSSTQDQTFTWSEMPLAEGPLDSCVSLSGFNVELAASSLSEACTDATQCTLSFEPEDTDDGIAAFILQTPQLQAPVGVRQQLTVTGSDDRASMTEIDFCLVAINEAPVAVNDNFVVLEGRREVFAENDVNLLSNDSDDIDVSNTEFRILPEPLEAPQKAAFFELGEDGSFTYESSLGDILADQIDSFVYQLSDGVHVSTATATIRIVAINQAPELLDAIPELTAVEGEEFLENLGLYFTDPEQSELSYALAADTPLPDEGSLELSEDGVLSGIPDEDDVGSHALTLVVSDGSASLETGLTLVIEAAPVVADNAAPEYVEDTVFNQDVRLGRAITPVIPEFIDPDGDILTYAIAGSSILPDGVEIDEDTGIVSGLPTEGTFVRNLRIQATDPFGETAISDAFYIRVR